MGPTEVTFSSRCFCCCCCCFLLFVSLFSLPTFHITHPIAPPLAPHTPCAKLQTARSKQPSSHGQPQATANVTYCYGQIFQGDRMHEMWDRPVIACSRESESRFSDMKQPVMFWKALQPLCVIVWPGSTCCARHTAHIVPKSVKT